MPGMSKQKESPFRVLFMFAVAMPLVGAGYIAGKQGLLGYFKVNLQAEFAGIGADYMRNVGPSDDGGELLRLPPAANQLFLAQGKGPRADTLWAGRVDQATKVAKSSVSVTDTKPLSPPSNRLGEGSTGYELASTQATVRELAHIRPWLKTVSHMTGINLSGEGQHFAGSQSANAFIASAILGGSAPLVHAYDDPEDGRPDNAGLPIKRAMIEGKGKHKFFGGLTEREFRHKEIRCLATAIYHEARGEPIKGQQAVAQTIMNRVRSHYYPDTVCGVIYQGSHRRTGCQFSFACDKISDTARDKKLWENSNRVATEVADGKVWLPDIGYASHYHATYVKPVWRKYMKRIKRIGVHIFYRGKFLPTPIEVAASNN